MEHIIHISEKGILNKSVVKSAFNVSPGRYLLKLTKSNKRSLNQNAYLHGVVIPIVLQGLRGAGFDDVKTCEDAKLIIKELFLKKETTNGSEVFKITKDTHDLTTTEMMEFIADVQKWASDYLGVYIPDPGQQVEIFN